MSSKTDVFDLGLTGSLRAAVLNKFASARKSGDLLFSDTQLTILRTGRNVPFQLRYCPALAKKPTRDASSPAKAKSTSKADPFEDPSPELLISKLHDSHLLVLNKYPVIPNHFILATKVNKPQTHLLETDDLAVSYACLRAWRNDASGDNDGQLYAFFNSGEFSGASQPHRHLQFLPVNDMRVSNSKWEDPETFDWSLLILTMNSNYHETSTLNYTSNARLPLRHFAVPLHQETPSSLHAKYIKLLKVALAATKTSPEAFIKHDEYVQLDLEGPANFSYNLAMTDDIMVICPRRSESAPIPGLDASHLVAINGTILGGTLMVKEQEEWDALRRTPHAIDSILEAIGYPATTPLQPSISPSTLSPTHL